jgi:hypothetical protein
MTYFEVSARSGKSIEMLKKMVRIKSAQVMKKYGIAPSNFSQEIQPESEEEQSEDLNIDDVET